jgi:ethanolamine utilization cobalamin adenosyltransferase
MDESKNVPLMISLPKKYRDFLRRIAAEKNLATPDNVVTAAGLGKQIICQYLEDLEKKDQLRLAEDMREELNKMAQSIGLKLNSKGGVGDVE